MGWTRRELLAGLGMVGACAALPPLVCEAGAALIAPGRLYPAMDLSLFDEPVHRGPSELRVGCASITWGGDERRAIEEIAALGYPGIQLRANAVKEFPDPKALAALLAQHKLAFVALSSGTTTLDLAKVTETVAMHAANAKYLHDAGGKYLQVIGGFAKGRTYSDADYRMQGTQLTEIGKRAAEYGIQTGFHNHMSSVGQTPEATDAILAAADPRYVKLELDVAHYVQGGGDAVAAIRKYGRRVLFLHLKDVGPSNNNSGYQFVELGQGTVNFKEIFAALKATDFRGWGVVELDGERTGDTRTPKESAEMSKQFLQKMGVQV